MSAVANIYVAIIDDDASACSALSRLLRTVGFQPITFPSAEAFLSDPMRPLFTCLLVDIQLAGMSGLELHRLLNAQGSRTPVIFVTAHDEPALRSEAIQNGCAAFLRKSDPGSMIIDALRRIAAPSHVS
jgi:FixJ family two-component response regulator